MKKIIAICLLLGLMGLLACPNIGFAKSPKAASSKLDEIQYDYISRLFAIKSEINRKLYELKLANIDAAAYRGAKIERAVKDAEREFNNINKDILLLKTEITQYYKGKIPQAVKEAITDTIKTYDDAKMDSYK